MATGRFWNIIRRGEEGPIVPVKDFDLNLFKTARELVKKYELKYDPENLVPTDEDLIDNAFKAACELLLKVGVYNEDSSRVIHIKEEELHEAIRLSPSEVILGEGKDQVILRHRHIEDKRLPTITGGIGAPVTEDLRLKIYMAYAMEPIIDVCEHLPVYTFQGVEVKAGTPFEVQAVLEDISTFRKAAHNVGRPGMAAKGRAGVSVESDIAASRPDIGYRPTDYSNVYFRPQLKCNYESLSRAVHLSQYGAIINTPGAGYIGGWAGGPEAAAICSIAESLAGLLIYNSHTTQTHSYNSVYMGHSESAPIWATNLGSAAMNKHTHTPSTWGVYITYAGPCTEMCLYEIAALSLGTSVLGNNTCGVSPNRGVLVNYCTPMESRLNGEVAHAATQLTRKEANQIIKLLIPKYDKYLKEKNPPLGKKFEELYDLNSLLPKQEYVELYERVWEELESLGLKKL
jgi:methylamine--corrinoid protein Co-methyltransferase